MTDAAFAQKTSLIERLRRPVSTTFAVVGLAAALFTIPPGLGQGWREALKLAGFLLLIVAALGRIWALIYIAGRKTRELCQAGPYSLTRNPLYLFSFFGVVGFTLALQNLLLAIIAAAGFLAYYAAVIRSEERRLRGAHESAFDAYVARVPRFWPKLQMPAEAKELQLNVAPFTRGLREVFWFLFVILVADGLEWLHLLPAWRTYTLPF